MKMVRLSALRIGRLYPYEVQYILEFNPHSVLGDFLNRKMSLCGSNPQLSFNRPLPTGRLIE
jgi:hypothetical protein